MQHRTGPDSGRGLCSSAISSSLLVDASPAHAGVGGMRRWVGLALVALSLTTLLVLVPAPRWAVAEELDVHSEPLALQPRSADRSEDPLAVAGLDPAEITERRSALASRARRASG